jgi:hypothetical protein
LNGFRIESRTDLGVLTVDVAQQFLELLDRVLLEPRRKIGSPPWIGGKLPAERLPKSMAKRRLRVDELLLEESSQQEGVFRKHALAKTVDRQDRRLIEGLQRAPEEVALTFANLPEVIRRLVAGREIGHCDPPKEAPDPLTHFIGGSFRKGDDKKSINGDATAQQKVNDRVLQSERFSCARGGLNNDFSPKTPVSVAQGGQDTRLGKTNGRHVPPPLCSRETNSPSRRQAIVSAWG